MVVLKMCGSKANAQMRLVTLFEGAKSFITWALSVFINLSLMLRFHLVYRPGELATFKINSASRSFIIFAHLRLVEDFTTVMAFEKPTHNPTKSNATPVFCVKHSLWPHFVLSPQRSSPLFAGGSQNANKLLP